MAAITFNIEALPDDILIERLNGISAISGRDVYIIREDLTLRGRSGITRFFWAILGAFCPCIRNSIYHSNLASIRNVFVALDNHPRLLANARLLAAYQAAQSRFNVLYPVRVQPTVHVAAGGSRLGLGLHSSLPLAYPVVHAPIVHTPVVHTPIVSPLVSPRIVTHTPVVATNNGVHVAAGGGHGASIDLFGQPLGIPSSRGASVAVSTSGMHVAAGGGHVGLRTGTPAWQGAGGGARVAIRV